MLLVEELQRSKTSGLLSCWSGLAPRPSPKGQRKRTRQNPHLSDSFAKAGLKAPGNPRLQRDGESEGTGQGCPRGALVGLAPARAAECVMVANLLDLASCARPIISPKQTTLPDRRPNSSMKAC